jgi:hypothetical protein
LGGRRRKEVDRGEEVRRSDRIRRRKEVEEVRGLKTSGDSRDL